MFQQYALFPNMNVWENVSYGPTIKDWDDKKTKKITSDVLDIVRLTQRADALPSELSGGMQQRVALARGIASGARILLLDEPLGALDARLRVDIRSQLRKLVKEQGLTAIHVTHDQEEALMIADRIVVLRNGKIEQIGSPLQIFTRPQSIFVANFVGGANFIEGYIVKIDSSGSLIEIQDGFQIRVSDTSRNIGERVVVAIRLEDTTIGKIEMTKSNNLHGRVESMTFIGGSMEYRVRLENGVTVNSRILISRGFKAYEIGNRVFFSFLPERCYLFPYPKTGLLKEIEAI